MAINGVRGLTRANSSMSLGKAGALQAADDDTMSRGGSPAEDVFVDHDGSRAARFSTELVGNRFRELQAARPAQREAAIRAGLIHDEENPRAFDDPILLRGTCTDMCPEYEREEREFKKNVDRWELRDGPAGLQGRIDPARAVSAFSRPAAGKDTGDEQVLPSDMRDPPTLSRTLDYLFRTILTRPPHDPAIPPTPFNSLKATHPFIWDRTRQVRQEFSKQKHWGLEHAVAGHERIARYHILCLRELRKTGINLQQEAEQLRKTLVSLTHYYNDLRIDLATDRPCANEAEFRAYLLILDMFDPETARATSVLPHAVFSQPILQLAFDLHALVQRNFDSQKAASRGNIQVAQNFASRFFKLVRSQRVPYVMACLLESRFADVRRAGLRALHQSYPKTEDPSKRMSINALMRMFGCVDENEVVDMVEAVEMEVVYEDDGPVGVFVNRSAPFNDNRDPPAAEPWPSITAKQGSASYSEIIDGVAGVQVGSGGAKKTAVSVGSTALGSNAAIKAFPTPTTVQNGSFGAFRNLPPSTSGPSFSFGSSAPRPPLQPSNQQPTAPLPAPAFPQPILPPSAPSFSFGKPSPAEESPATPVRQLSPPTAPAPVAPSPPKASHPQPPVVETYYEEALEVVANHLVTATVQQLTSKIATSVAALVERETQAALQEARVRARAELLDHIAEEMYDNMLIKAVARTSIGAVMEEARRRNLARHVSRFWCEWARIQRQERDERQRRRLAFSKRMEDMRHSRRLVSDEDVEMLDDTSEISVHETATEIKSDADRADELRKAQAERALFWEPGTYLDFLAQHVDSLLLPMSRHGSNDSRPSASEKRTWKVMVSTTDRDTGKWVHRKLAVGKPSLHRDRAVVHAVGAPEQARHSRKTFTSVGMVVFEVSRAVSGSEFETQERYAEDRRRFGSIRPVLHSGNEYRPALLLIAWDDESLPAIEQRLGIPPVGSNGFDSIGLLGLGHQAGDIAAFRQSAIDTLKRVTIKPRFDLHLLPMVQAIYPVWTELMLLAVSTVQNGVNDWLDYTVILQLMIDSINDARRVILTAIASDYSGPSLGIVKLPVFEVEHKIVDSRSASVAMLKYLQNPAFVGMDDVSLLVSDVRNAINGQTEPPTRLFLENLAYAVSSRLAAKSVPLDIYESRENQSKRMQALCDDMCEVYGSILKSKASVVEKLVKPVIEAPPPPKAPLEDVFSAPTASFSTPIRALPDLSSAAAFMQTPPEKPVPSPGRKRRLDSDVASGTDTVQGSARESKILRLRRLMGQVKDDLNGRASTL